MNHADRQQWFLVQHKPNCAKKAQTNLERQGYLTFLPFRHETLRRNGQFSSARKPLFPGYMFVALTGAAKGWHAINSTFGVTRLVSFGDTPAQVLPQVVTGIMSRCDETGTYNPEALFAPGDVVRLNTGPFADFFAQVERVASDQRVWLLLDLLGRQIRLAVHHESIERLPATAAQ